MSESFIESKINTCKFSIGDYESLSGVSSLLPKGAWISYYDITPMTNFPYKKGGGLIVETMYKGQGISTALFILDEEVINFSGSVNRYIFMKRVDDDNVLLGVSESANATTWLSSSSQGSGTNIDTVKWAQIDL